MIEIDLLEYLQLQCGCEYLSDLKYSSRWMEKMKTLKHPEQFTIREWNRALEYLTEVPSDCHTICEVNEYLAVKCGEKRQLPQKNGGKMKRLEGKISAVGKHAGNQK